MKKIKFMDVSFRDGFQSVLGARVKTADFLPALQAAVAAGTTSFEIGGGARFQSPYFYCQEDAFEMMDRCRAVVGPEINLQTLARGINVVGLMSQPSEIIDLHAKLFKKHGVSTIRNFDALNDVRNLDFSGRCIANAGLHHQVAITLMGLPPNMDTTAHTAEFYMATLKGILAAGLPFHSVCFKDASGTCPPAIIHETVKRARQILDAEGHKDKEIEFHTHCTADLGMSCLMAAIEGGADIIDVGMSPMSGGTGAPDILTVWHALKGTAYTLDIDYEKYLVAEEVFEECMSKYLLPPEAKETNPTITLSPMPGGALTANTQMMRDNNCLHKFPEVIKAMREVVERGGFGTSVTPVSQFYFQQAFNNVMLGPWKKIADGYGKMVLGHFGKTPAQPDPEIVKIAADQLKLAPTTEEPRLLNDRNESLGIKAATRKLEAAGLPLTDENIFIVACCSEGKTDKGLDFLKGIRPNGIYYKEDDEKRQLAALSKKYGAPAGAAAPTAAAEAGEYTVAVDGKSYHVTAQGETLVVDGRSYRVNVQAGAAAPAAPVAAPAAAAAPAPAAGAGESIKAPMPGTILKVMVKAGDSVKGGDTIVVLEAMKMEIEVKAAVGGTVSAVHVAQGATVQPDQVMAVLG